MLTASVVPRIDDVVTRALRASRRRLGGVAVFSGVINLLMLAGPLYMLQVYDRVIPSHSVATLLGLSLIVLIAYLLQGYLEALRSRMLSRIGTRFDVGLQESIHVALATLPLTGTKPLLAQQPLRDLDQVRAFLSGIGPTAFLDMPWMPLFVIALFLFHPLMGMMAVLGAAAIIAVSLAAERQGRGAARAATECGAQRQVLADATRNNADAIRALGMTGRLTARWSRANEAFLAENVRAADVAASLGSGAKMLRFVLQSTLLGTGAYLVVIEQASGGIMIASSIMMGRALAPIEIALGTWKQLVAARQAITRLQQILKATTPTAGPAVALPRPYAELSVENLRVHAPGTDRAVIADVTFRLRAGSGLGLLGASASGKSSLSKALVGVWPPAHGVVRLDGAALNQWQRDDLGRHIGYLPQEVGLLDGSVAQNIARFDEAAESDLILEAAQIAGAHDMILRLPNGYATRIGEGGMTLSAGQRQRIGLARAVFGDPFLIVLDEPNANLDADGELALSRAIDALRRHGCIVVVVSHRPNALSALDMAMVLRDGQAIAFGRRDEVFAHIAGPSIAAAAKPRGPASAGRMVVGAVP
jgi:ATP-binding cassette, subfamily C, bacterial PrsD